MINKATEGKIILSVFFHNPSKELFESIVKWFLDHDFKFISADELYQIGIFFFTVLRACANSASILCNIFSYFYLGVFLLLSLQPLRQESFQFLSEV